MDRGVLQELLLDQMRAVVLWVHWFRGIRIKRPGQTRPMAFPRHTHPRYRARWRSTGTRDMGSRELLNILALHNLHTEPDSLTNFLVRLAEDK